MILNECKTGQKFYPILAQIVIVLVAFGSFVKFVGLEDYYRDVFWNAAPQFGAAGCMVHFPDGYNSKRILPIPLKCGGTVDGGGTVAGAECGAFHKAVLPHSTAKEIHSLSPEGS